MGTLEQNLTTNGMAAYQSTRRSVVETFPSETSLKKRKFEGLLKVRDRRRDICSGLTMDNGVEIDKTPYIRRVGEHSHRWAPGPKGLSGENFLFLFFFPLVVTSTAEHSITSLPSG